MIMRRLRLTGNIILLMGMFFIIGCSNSSSPTGPISDSPTTHSAGDFGYSVNSTPHSKSATTIGSVGRATVVDGAQYGLTPGMKMLQVNLLIESFTASDFHLEQLALLIPFRNPVPATFNIGGSEAPTLAQAVYVSDSLSYRSESGGSIVLSEFDTVNNLVSGTFDFDVTIAPPPNGSPTTIHITGGYFQKIPIYVGNFGQGTMSASINGLGFTANQELSAYTTTGLDALIIVGANSLGEEFTISLSHPGVGSFNLTAGFGIGTTGATYSGNVGLCKATSGTFVITKYDRATHRMEATFNFSGTDASSGEKIDITDGKMNNVQWADL